MSNFENYNFKKSKIFILSGMFRSGTSMLAKFMKESGINMGDKFGENDEFNKHGYYEDLDFYRLQEKELTNNKVNYSKILIPSDIFKQEAKTLFDKKNFNNWGWKDPKNTLFLNFWLSCDNNSNFIFIFRKPEFVINSHDRMFNPDKISNLRIDFFKKYIYFNKLIIDFIIKNSDKNIILFSFENLVNNSEEILSVLSEKTEFKFNPEIFKKLYDENVISSITYDIYSEYPKLAQQTTSIYNELCLLSKQQENYQNTKFSFENKLTNEINEKITGYSITVTISTKNRYFTTLPLCLTSISNQTILPKKIIIFDDGDHLDLLKEDLYINIFSLFKTKNIEFEIILGTNEGQVKNHQKSLEVVTTSLIFRCDDDCILEPNVLETLLNTFMDKTAAVSCLILDSKYPIAKNLLSSNKIEDVNLGINEQWFLPETNEIKKVDHLYSAFMFKKNAAPDYCKELSQVCYAEETLFTYEMTRNGWDCLINPNAIIWHFHSKTGGIRENTKLEMWKHDDSIFQKKLKDWGVKPLIPAKSWLYINDNINEKSKIYILTGVFRSGTSLFARFMHESGINMGNIDITDFRANKHGNYEDIDFLNLHQNEFLKHFNILPDYPLIYGNFQLTDDFKQNAKILFINKKNKNINNNWGWKDPRNCLFLDYWSLCDNNINFIFIFRNPESVVNSLDKNMKTNKSNLAIIEFLKLYIYNNQKIIDFINKNPNKNMVSFSFDDLIENPDKILSMINKKIKFEFNIKLFKKLYNKELVSSNNLNLEQHFDLLQQAKLVYNELCSISQKTQNIYTSFEIKDYTYNITFLNGCKVEIQGDENSTKEFVIEIIGPNSNDINSIGYRDVLKPEMFTKSDIQYYKNWHINIKHNNELLVEYDINLKNQNVLIVFDSKCLGDTLAWIPYVEEFRKKHNCIIYCATFQNHLFWKEYPEIKFIDARENENTLEYLNNFMESINQNIYAIYYIGWYAPWNNFPIQDQNGNIFGYQGTKNPNDFKKIPLQQTASDILGLEFKEIKPKITTLNHPRPIEEKYICISEFSTGFAKQWNYPIKGGDKGWQEIVDWLNQQGYKVMIISKEKTHLKNILDNTGDFPIEQRINEINHCEFFIGVSSGLAWLSWALNKKVIMISNFTEPFFEFQNNCIRINNFNACHGCWHKYDIDRGNFDWCPENKDFECTKSITSEMVIRKIKNSNLLENEENIIDSSIPLNNNFKISFIDGVKVENLTNNVYLVEIIGPSNNEYDKNNLTIIEKIKSKQIFKIDISYYKNWIVNIIDNDKIIYSEYINLINKNVLIVFVSAAIGDAVAWIPYVEEFRKKHQCNIYCQTHQNYLFEKSYSEINFIEAKEGQNSLEKNIYARYFIGLSYWDNFPINDENDNIYEYQGIKQPNDHKTIPLQQTASDILGLEFKELKAKLDIPNLERPIKGKYICISEFSRHTAKHWNYPNGWQNIVDWLNTQGYKVMIISEQKTELRNVIDHTGSYPLEQRINEINYCEFMITISTGLAWIAWSLNKKVVMISGFTKPYCEFQENCIRVINENVCNGCFNRVDIDWKEKDWCPDHKNTEKQFECTKKITPKMVKDEIKKLIL